MRRKWLHILVLAWQCLWLLVIVPGHTRGQIVLPGTATPTPAAEAADGPQLRALVGCCAVAPEGDDPSDPISEERKRDCAVCHFAVRMSVAVAYVPPIERPTLLNVLPAEVARDVAAVAIRGVPMPRGPPGRVDDVRC